MDTSAIADTFDTLVDDALIWMIDNWAFLFDWVRAVFEGFYDGVLGLGAGLAIAILLDRLSRAALQRDRAPAAAG